MCCHASRIHSAFENHHKQSIIEVNCDRSEKNDVRNKEKIHSACMLNKMLIYFCIGACERTDWLFASKSVDGSRVFLLAYTNIQSNISVNCVICQNYFFFYFLPWNIAQFNERKPRTYWNVFDNATRINVMRTMTQNLYKYWID